MLSTDSVLLPVFDTFACHPVGAPVGPSAASASATWLPLEPHTGPEALSCKIVPSALLKPASATGALAGQNAVATPTAFLAVDTEAFAIVNLLSLDADVERQLKNASYCC